MILDLIEELLKNLRIKHVALASHSAGAIYSFNFALKLRHLLHPINPLICFMGKLTALNLSGSRFSNKILIAPWVSPEHSKVLVCSAARFLPSPILRQFYILEIIDRSIPPRAKCVVYNAYIGMRKLFANVLQTRKLLSVRRLRKRFSPHKQISGEDSPHDDDSFIEPIPCNQTADDIDGSRPDSLSSKTSDSRNVDTASGRLDEEISLKNGSNIQVSGVPLASNIDPELEPDSQTCSQDRVSVDSSLYFACKFSEKFKGMSEDLLLCLRRKGITSWGSFSDYDEAIKLLQDQETRLLALDYQGRKRSRLRVETFLAGQDSLIGKKGATWFDKLWEGQEEWVEYDSEIIEGFEHNQIPTRRAGCLEWIMDMTAWAWERAVEENGEDVESLRSR